jgi:hypothetical protein
MSYIERERQRGEALQQEQLDWLHQQHEELAEQTRLLRVQTEALGRIATHTHLFYVVTILWIVFTVVGLLALLLGGFR